MNTILYNIYNATNHDIIYYINPKDYTSNRNEQFYLINKNSTEKIIIPQSKPLSVRRNLKNFKLVDKLSMFYPQHVNAYIDILDNYLNYDIIIVSSSYANMVLQKSVDNFSYYSEFIDRLFVPIPLYLDDPKKNKSTTKEGCVGLQKVSSPKIIEYYYNQILNNQKVSLAAVQTAIEYFYNYIHNFNNNVVPDNYNSILNVLNNYINNYYNYNF